MKNLQSIIVISTALTLAACNTTSVAPAPVVSPSVPKPSLSFSGTSVKANLAIRLPTRDQLLKTASDSDATQKVVVGYSTNTEAKLRAYITALGAEIVQTIEPKSSTMRMALVRLPSDLSATKFSGYVSLSGQFNFAQTEVRIQKPTVSASLEQQVAVAPQVAASDPLLAKQWWLSKIKADQVRDIATGAGVIVGVVDEDFNRLHEDLKATGKIVDGLDTSNDNILTPTTPLTSGTHGSGSAGIIAERMNNGVGGAGVAPDAVLMPIRIFTDDDISFTGDFNVALGIIWAVDNGAKVLNNSWGGGGYSQAIKDAVDYALYKNVVVVGSAGNDYSDLHNGLAAFPGVISVGASTNSDTKTNFSNIGPRVDLFAPGDDGLTTYSDTNDGYGLFNGTSMAAPVVSGAAALILERAEKLGVTLTPYQVKKILTNNTDPMNGQPQGRLNVQKALQFTKDTVPAKGSMVWVSVVDSIEKLPVSAVDVTLIPLSGQNKGLAYTAQTSNSELFDLAGVAIFDGVEPGEYQVQVSGPTVWFYGGSRSTLTQKITVKAGETSSLDAEIPMDWYESIYELNDNINVATDLTTLDLTKSPLLAGKLDFLGANYTDAPENTPDLDFYKITLATGQAFSATVFSETIGSLAKPEITLYNSSQTEVLKSTADSDGNQSLAHTPTSGGTFYLKLSNTTGGKEGANSYYALQLKQVSAP